MQHLRPDDVLPLTCTREGACCLDAKVQLTPWELAVLARGISMSARDFRRQHTTAGGTVLQFANRTAVPGRKACDLYVAGQGCRTHASRPLACRLFPLGSARAAGQRSYHHPGRATGCAELCPSSLLLPKVRVRDYLAEQQVALGEEAHDAYAGMLAALVATAGEITQRCGSAFNELRAEAWLRTLENGNAQERADQLPAHVLDLLTIPGCVTPLERPADFVAEHRRLVVDAVTTGFGLVDTQSVVHALLGMAFILAPAVGTASQLVVQAYNNHHAQAA
jgi:uncharacterized protein